MSLLTDGDIEDLHYRWEVHSACSIKASERGSADRRRLFDGAYEGLLIVLGEMRRRKGRELDIFGFNPNSVDRVCEVLPAPPGVFWTSAAEPECWSKPCWREAMKPAA